MAVLFHFPQNTTIMMPGTCLLKLHVYHVFSTYPWVEIQNADFTVNIKYCWEWSKYPLMLYKIYKCWTSICPSTIFVWKTVCECFWVFRSDLEQYIYRSTGCFSPVFNSWPAWRWRLNPCRAFGEIRYESLASLQAGSCCCRALSLLLSPQPHSKWAGLHLLAPSSTGMVKGLFWMCNHSDCHCWETLSLPIVMY